MTSTDMHSLSSLNPELLQGFSRRRRSRRKRTWARVLALGRAVLVRIPWSWSGVLIWGVRSLSLGLVLALPPDFPHRSPLVGMASGVIALSIALSIARLKIGR